MRKEVTDLTVNMPDGQTEIFYFDCKPYNGTVYWDADGIVGTEFEVKNGLKDGLEQEYLAGGIVISAINYKDGQEEGIGKYFYKSGKLKEEIYFQMGEIIWSKTYDEDGKCINKYEIDKESSSYRRLQFYLDARERKRTNENNSSAQR